MKVYETFSSCMLFVFVSLFMEKLVYRKAYHCSTTYYFTTYLYFQMCMLFTAFFFIAFDLYGFHRMQTHFIMFCCALLGIHFVLEFIGCYWVIKTMIKNRYCFSGFDIILHSFSILVIVLAIIVLSIIIYSRNVNYRRRHRNKESSRRLQKELAQAKKLYNALIQQDEELSEKDLKFLLDSKRFKRFLIRLKYGSDDEILIARFLFIDDINKQNLFKVEDDTECIICLDKIKTNQAVIGLYCKHIYHKDCFMDWAVKNMKCCVCSKNVRISTLEGLLEQYKKNK